MPVAGRRYTRKSSADDTPNPSDDQATWRPGFISTDVPLTNLGRTQALLKGNGATLGFHGCTGRLQRLAAGLRRGTGGLQRLTAGLPRGTGGLQRLATRLHGRIVALDRDTLGCIAWLGCHGHGAINDG